MAIEVFPDSPNAAMSPRISFSHGLSQAEDVPIEQYIRSGSSSSIEFDFCVFRESFDQESSSADELFFDGKILPIQIKKRLSTPRTTPFTAEKPPTKTSRAHRPPPAIPPPPPPPPHRTTKKTATSDQSEEKQCKSSSSSSFWGFKRSTSLNCGSGYARTLCPLPLLSRSNSTGSTASSKRSSLSSSQKQNILRNSSNSTTPLKQSLFATSSFSATQHQKPPLKKNNHLYSNGMKINPVLNVPHANLFGFGSMFSGGSRDKMKKKYY